MNREQFNEYENDYIEILATKVEKLNDYMVVSEKYDKVFYDRHKLVTDCEVRHRIDALKSVIIAALFAIFFGTLSVFLEHLIPANINIFIGNHFFNVNKLVCIISSFLGFVFTLIFMGRVKKMEDCMINARVDAIEVMQKKLYKEVKNK